MAFSEDGYAVERVFDRQEITGLQEEITAYVDRVAKALNLPFESSCPDAPFDERIERIAEEDPSYAQLLASAVCTDAHRSPAFERIVADSRLMSCAARFLGTPVGHQTVRVRGNSSKMSAQRQAWHSDVALDDGGDCSKVKLTAWIPLTDAGPESGGLEVAAGRRDAPMPHTQKQRGFEIAESHIAGPKVPIVCPQGSALFLDRYTPHRALQNTSGKTRWSLVIWMKPAAA